MHETIAPTIAGPISLTPVGGSIAVLSAEISDEHNLDSRGELLHADGADVDRDVVIVVVCCMRVERLDGRAIARRNACSTNKISCNQNKGNLEHYQSRAYDICL